MTESKLKQRNDSTTHTYLQEGGASVPIADYIGPLLNSTSSESEKPVQPLERTAYVPKRWRSILMPLYAIMSLIPGPLFICCLIFNFSIPFSCLMFFLLILAFIINIIALRYYRRTAYSKIFLSISIVGLTLNIASIAFLLWEMNISLNACGEHGC